MDQPEQEGGFRSRCLPRGISKFVTVVRSSLAARRGGRHTRVPTQAVRRYWWTAPNDWNHRVDNTPPMLPPAATACRPPPAPTPAVNSVNHRPHQGIANARPLRPLPSLITDQAKIIRSRHPPTPAVGRNPQRVPPANLTSADDVFGKRRTVRRWCDTALRSGRSYRTIDQGDCLVRNGRGDISGGAGPGGAGEVAGRGGRAHP